MNLKSYSLINEISTKFFQRIITGENVLAELEGYGNIIAQTVCDDFCKIVNEKLSVEQIFFYYEEEHYRQGATACVIKTHFENDPNLIANFECLIDHQAIFVRVKGELIIIESLKKVVSKIQEKYNSEGLVNLKDIQN